MKLKNFTFYVRNDTTKEIVTFIGSGETLETAWSDAMKTITSAWHPSSDGKQNGITNRVLELNVRTPVGANVSRLKADFEGEESCKP